MKERLIDPDELSMFSKKITEMLLKHYLVSSKDEDIEEINNVIETCLWSEFGGRMRVWNEKYGRAETFGRYARENISGLRHHSMTDDELEEVSKKEKAYSEYLKNKSK